MKNVIKQKLFESFKLIIPISIVIITILAINITIPDSSAEEEVVVGNNTGYGMVTVNYHSNYLSGTAANGKKATEVVYSITTPIYLNAKGEYCISLGEYKFAEKQVSSDGVKAPNTDANAIDTGFRGYTLKAAPSGMRDSKGFWVGKATGSNGPDDIPDAIMNNSYAGVKRVFNDWEDGIYQQGDELVLNSSNLTGYNNIDYLATYDTNRNGGKGRAGDTRYTYTLDVYAQWVKANIIYVASSSSASKATSLNSTFGVANITASKIKTSMTSAIGGIKNVGANMYENYIVITDTYNADYSSMGYAINIKETVEGNGFTLTSKYFGVDTSGRALLTGESIIMMNDWRIRDIDLYSLKTGNTGTNNFYSRGYMIVIEYGVRCFVGTTASAAKSNEITNINFDGSNTSKRGCFNVNVDGHTGYEISRATYAKVLSGHVFRYLIDRQNAEAYANKYVYYVLGGTGRADLLLAGPAQGTIQYTTSKIVIKDQAILHSLYGGNQGHSSGNYWALDCKSYLNIYGNATIQDGIYGGGGGREANIPFFSGEIYINVCGGNVATIYGTGAASAVIPKSDGTDSNIYININGGKISTIYGAGNGMSYDATGMVSTFSVINGSLTGNVAINITNATIGNVYGGGEGYNAESGAKGCAYRNGDATITIGSGTIITGNVYGGGKGFSSHPKATNLSNVNKTLRWNSSNAEYKYTLSKDLLSIVSSIETASIVDGYTTINIVGDAVINGNVYGGGEYAGTTSSDKVTINIDGATVLGNVFGGGYSGPLEASVDMSILKGNFQNIFGGADQSYVAGNTTVVIGNKNDLGIVVNGLVYGGGRGVDSNKDGDASDYITVKGSSNVIIEGINTSVNNYGSIKLGAVAGEVDVIFKNYWTGNNTAKYKTMNGIDRATTVTFDNSYVLLENKDENGNLSGIKAIGTLIIPDGSGIKISADGEITKDFIGGGEIYLDSGICLIVDGNISNVTKMTINPTFSSENNANIILGGIENPYMIVKGNSLATDVETNASELISGEKRYTILSKKVEESTNNTSAYYYITQTIIITNYIEIQSISSKDRVYVGDIVEADSIALKNKDVFSSNIELSYELLEKNVDDSNIGEVYKKLSREFVIKKSQQELITIPKGTEITMKLDNNYYTYIVEEDTTKIPLTKFKDASNNSYSGGFINIKDKTTGIYDQLTNITSYTYNEEYRFIINFENVKNPIPNGRYYSMINVYDNSIWIDENQIEAANIIVVENRIYDLDYTLNQDEYDGEDIININGNLNIGEISSELRTNKRINLNVNLLDYSGNNIGFPDGTKVILNGIEKYVKDGKVKFDYLDNVSNDENTEYFELVADMSRVLPQNRLYDGEYSVIIEIMEDDLNIVEKEFYIPIIIKNIESKDYGLKALLNEKILVAENSNQIIVEEDNKQREINLNYNSIIQDTKVKIKAIERVSPFVYEETDNSKKIKTQINGIDVNELTSLNENQIITVDFSNEVLKGTYRISFELYNKYDKKLTETFVNFIVL